MYPDADGLHFIPGVSGYWRNDKGELFTKSPPSSLKKEYKRQVKGINRGPSTENFSLSVNTCPYQKASHLRRLDSSDVQRIEKERNKILQTKIDVLEQLTERIRMGNYNNLLENSFYIIQKSLSVEDFDFYIITFDIKKCSARFGLDIYFGGGLRELLEFAAICECDIAIRFKELCRKRLIDLICFDDLNRPSLKFRNYFDAIGKPEKKLLDMAINNEIKDSFDQMSQYISEQEKRLSKLIRSYSKNKITLTFEVPGKDIAMFSVHMNSSARQFLKEEDVLTADT